MTPKAIVLGGYGLIGSACMRALGDAGFRTVGIGRSRPAAMACAPDAEWVIRDIPSLSPQDWHEILSGAAVVVNASGALQDGARDNLEAIHVTAIRRLVEGCADMDIRLVQISAAGASPDASTAFFRTKAQGDAIIASGARDWVILRPTLVLSPDAYGGTALLRAFAAMPALMPVVFPQAKIQTIHVGDLCAAIVATAKGAVPNETIADLTEPDAWSFPELAAKLRRWQGFSDPRFTPHLPRICLTLAGKAADLLGRLGWRSPLRTTALAALSEGIRGDPAPWMAAGGAPCRTLDETLATLPATRQERLFARAYIALPLAIATLALFWCLSGLIALVDVPGAVAILTARSVPASGAGVLVTGGAAADIILGLAILWRPWTKMAALGMITLSAGYLIGSLVVAPGLWADPLGPMVKVIPGMTLAALVWLMMEDR